MKLKVNITREDYADFNKFHFMKTGLRKSIITYSIALIIIELFLNRNGFDLFATLFSSFLFISICCFLTYNRLNKTKQIPNDDGSFLGETQFEFLEDKILYKRYNSEGNVSWSIIKSFGEGKNAFYLYVDSIAAYTIPKRIFNSKDEMIAFQNLVKRNLQNNLTQNKK